MAKKVTITLIVLYLMGVIGGATSALSMNWNAGWPLDQQLSSAVKTGFGWPMAVVELFTAG